MSRPTTRAGRRCELRLYLAVAELGGSVDRRGGEGADRGSVRADAGHRRGQGDGGGDGEVLRGRTGEEELLQRSRLYTHQHVGRVREGVRRGVDESGGAVGEVGAVRAVRRDDGFGRLLSLDDLGHRSRHATDEPIHGEQREWGRGEGRRASESSRGLTGKRSDRGFGRVEGRGREDVEGGCGEG